jgi:hypothetical protein
LINLFFVVFVCVYVQEAIVGVSEVTAAAALDLFGGAADPAWTGG